MLVLRIILKDRLAGGEFLSKRHGRCAQQLKCAQLKPACQGERTSKIGAVSINGKRKSPGM
jgi:hypothetical protein